MTVITISRQFGSHDDTVAQLLCDRLGYRYFNKSLMLGLAAAMAWCVVPKIAAPP